MVSNLLKEIKKAKKDNIDIHEYNKIKDLIADKDYLFFLLTSNGGFAFGNSLHFYGVLPNKIESEIFYNNFLFQKYYQDLIKVVLVFCEDTFGNQYAFLNDNKIAFINIETAEIEFLFTDFKNFVEEIYKETDFYTGFSIMEKWSLENGAISEFKRLCPKKPFVIGGDYTTDNFYALEKEKLLDYNSYIAKQIKNLPDGVQIQLKVI